VSASGRGHSVAPTDGAPASEEEREASVGRSAVLISVCVAISRITGFIRTWAMGFAMGTTLLSSSYQVACNLPNQLYELVVGGMLVTAFLPVYVGLRKREGAERANAYASTLMGVVLVFLGVIALLATVFAPQVVWTQMFLNDAGDRDLVTYFFRFFAIQLVFYGVSAVTGGLLNARRDYLWSSAAPIANNLVVIAAMFAYVFVAPADPELAKLVIAVGTPLGVFTQMAIQLPALAKNGIRLKPWRIDLHDPALRETLSLGIPTVVVTVASFVTVSVQNAAAMAASDAGSSVLFYARQWFTLPYAFLSVPITTALFTELSDLAADGDRGGLRSCILGGTQKNFLFMIPFALYLMVFAVPLVSLFQAGSFSAESVAEVAGYLRFMAVSLPFYALFLFMQKTFSALRRMRAYAVANVVASAAQVALTLLLCLGAGEAWSGLGLPGIAVAQTAFFLLGCVWCYAYLQRELGGILTWGLARGALVSLALGAAGAVVGAAVLWALQTFVAPLGAGGIAQSFAYVVAGGLAALAVTYGLALKLHVPGSEFIGRLAAKVLRRG
jgi:putative peptidoglycan lipid II flippase